MEQSKTKTSNIIFYGGAGTVTGANFMLADNESDAKILIDCGMLQGLHHCDDSNWNAFAYDPKAVEILIITHAHIDHIGKIPRLVREGFHGRIISTKATLAIAGPLLDDAMELLAHDAERCNQPPLYEQKDIDAALALWEGFDYHQPLKLPGGYTLEFYNSGHILGSAMAHISRDGNTIMFTGDLGGGNSPILPPCEDLPTGTQYLLMESVYGDRVRAPGNPRDELEHALEDAVQRGGPILIPAFSTERSQDLLFEIKTLMTENRIPHVPVYLDSPLASKITAAFRAHPEYFAPEIRARVEAGEDIFAFPELRFVRDAHESAGILDRETGSVIIIAGSGMSNGGRILAHELQVLPNPKGTVIIVGYQAAGSLGRRVLEGAKMVQLQHEDVPVRSTILSLFGYSAHMDGEELVEFVNKGSGGLEEVFVTMGEPASSMTLAQRLRDYLGVRAVVPEAGSMVEIKV